jgi:hypothetical protein
VLPSGYSPGQANWGQTTRLILAKQSVSGIGVARGRSDMTGKLDGTDCAITIAPHAGATGGFDGRGLVVRVSNSCAITEDGTVAPIDPGASEGTGGGRASSGGASGVVTTNSGGGNSGGTSGGGTSSGGRAASNPNAGGAAGVVGSGGAATVGSMQGGARSSAAESCAIGRGPRKDPFSAVLIGALLFALAAGRRGIAAAKLELRECSPLGPASPRRSS